MSSVHWILVLLLAAALVVHRLRRPELAPPAPARRVPRLPERSPATAPAPAPALPQLEWNAPIAPPGDLPAALRDRYIAARFPGLFHGSADLRATERVVKAARHLFEEDEPELAHELLQLAIEQSADSKVPRLAQLEIAFLARDADRYTALAHAFLAACPAAAEWVEVARLGRALAPAEAAFGPAPGSSSHEHYGPWPDMPNWIQASWDLTSEILAADLHRAMTQPAPALPRSARHAA